MTSEDSLLGGKKGDRSSKDREILKLVKDLAPQLNAKKGSSEQSFPIGRIIYLFSEGGGVLKYGLSLKGTVVQL